MGTLRRLAVVFLALSIAAGAVPFAGKASAACPDTNAVACADCAGGGAGPDAGGPGCAVPCAGVPATLAKGPPPPSPWKRAPVASPDRGAAGIVAVPAHPPPRPTHVL